MSPLDLGPTNASVLLAAMDPESEAAYRRRVLSLTAERDAALKEVAKVRSEWKQEVRILRAQLSEGTSPRVEALERTLSTTRAERDALKSALRAARGQ